jgi:NYN domain
MAGRPARVGVFIDYQNCYNEARRAFHDPDNDPGEYGHFSPRGLADLMVGMAKGRVLSYAGVYVGLPNPRLDPRTSSARTKQIAAWSKTGITVVARPIRYPQGWPNVAEKPQEKGVDVKLAIDALMMSITRQFEVIVIASLDSDLKPLLESLLRLRPRVGLEAIEVIAWEGRSYRLRLPGEALPERELTTAAYHTIQDVTDYTI